MRDTRRHLEPRNRETVLDETAARLLTEEGQSVPDWEIVDPQITAETCRQSSQLLANAWPDYDAFARLRVQAVHAYGRVDHAVCGLAAIVAGYVFRPSQGRDSYRWRRPILGLA